jgi:hypothetical protein
MQWLFATGFLVCAGTAPARAQMGMRGPDLRGVFRPVVGAGAEYVTEHAAGSKTTTEISIVGKEQVNGKDAYWMEIGLASPSGAGTMYVKTLNYVDGDSLVTSRTIMQIPDQQPMEMNSQMGMRGNQPPRSTDVRKEAERVGTEAVTTPAGTFVCEHWRQKDGSADFWISEKVAPWGLVKRVSNNSTMTLQRVITDAKTHITGTPIKFDPMNMMRQPQQP